MKHHGNSFTPYSFVVHHVSDTACDVHGSQVAKVTRGAARKAPHALEREAVTLDCEHMERARAVGLDGAPLAQVCRAEPRGSRAVGGREASRELGGDAACEVHARQEGSRG